jgi:hypothetical protein
MEMTSQPHALYRFVMNAPMIVERRWPTWKLLAMFGDEYSMSRRLPFPIVFVPYSGVPDGVSCVSACTWSSTSRFSVGVVHVKCTNALSAFAFAT